ncbi:hypothetical protein CM1200mP19_0750 [bacterium]|nr:MAG: hypothetical protein CM1200mP19_0750 [bacterium]
MLKVGGENVAAAEVEGPLNWPSFGASGTGRRRSGPRYTEVPAAFIQLVEGESATEEELMDYCLGAIETLQGAEVFSVR